MRQIDEVYSRLSDSTSEYYCGSACFLSLIPLCQYYQTVLDEELRENFFLLIEASEKLSYEDAFLFEMSKKETYTDKELDRISSVFESYITLIENLTDVVSCISETKTKKLFKDTLIFVSRLCQQNAAHFFTVENVPEQLIYLINSALAEIRRNYE